MVVARGEGGAGEGGGEKDSKERLGAWSATEGDHLESSGSSTALLSRELQA